MANTLRDTFSDIADAIRAKGVTGTMTPLEMPTKIGSISGGGSKYGVPIDGLLADVDQNGQLGNPTEPFSFTSNDIRTVLEYALQYKLYKNAGITSLSLPNLTSVNLSGMYWMCQNCSNLTSVNLPSLTSIGANGMQRGFFGCTSLTNIDLSSLSSVSGAQGMSNAFQNCTSLTSVDLSSLSSASSTGLYQTFYGCTSLQEVKFNNATAVPPIQSNTFGNTNSTFKIIVPDALYSQWKTATNWSALASQIVKVSEYTPAS